MLNNRQLDEIRERFQEALIETKREELVEQYGMQFASRPTTLSLEEENAWLDYILEFERQFAQAETITVAERIGNPVLRSRWEISAAELEEAVTDLLVLLATHGIAVDFLGEFDDWEVYRYLTEELLGEEIDDIRIEGLVTHFTVTTPEYDAVMWVENFVFDLLAREKACFLPELQAAPILDGRGRQLTGEQFERQVAAVWEHWQPGRQLAVEPITVEVRSEEARVTAVVAWPATVDCAGGQVESVFYLQPNPYAGWDVVQTSLLDDLLGLWY